MPRLGGTYVSNVVIPRATCAQSLHLIQRPHHLSSQSGSSSITPHSAASYNSRSSSTCLVLEGAMMVSADSSGHDLKPPIVQEQPLPSSHSITKQTFQCTFLQCSSLLSTRLAFAVMMHSKSTPQHNHSLPCTSVSVSAEVSQGQTHDLLRRVLACQSVSYSNAYNFACEQSDRPAGPPCPSWRARAGGWGPARAGYERVPTAR